MKKDMTIEQAILRLEEITKKMQNDEMSVEDSLKMFEEGTKLVEFCNKKIKEAEIRISGLTQSGQGDENG